MISPRVSNVSGEKKMAVRIRRIRTAIYQGVLMAPYEIGGPSQKNVLTVAVKIK